MTSLSNEKAFEPLTKDLDQTWHLPSIFYSVIQNN